MSFANGFGKKQSGQVDYQFARDEDGSIRVTKWAGTEEPLDEYKVQLGGPCECPAWQSKRTRPCKHHGMATAWVEAGEPEAGNYRCIGIGKEWAFEKVHSNE